MDTERHRCDEVTHESSGCWMSRVADGVDRETDTNGVENVVAEGVATATRHAARRRKKCVRAQIDQAMEIIMSTDDVTSSTARKTRFSDEMCRKMVPRSFLRTNEIAPSCNERQ